MPLKWFLNVKKLRILYEMRKNYATFEGLREKFLFPLAELIVKIEEIGKIFVVLKLVKSSKLAYSDWMKIYD